MKDVTLRSVHAIAEALSTLKGVPVAELLPPEQPVPGWISWENFVHWMESLDRSRLAPIDWKKTGVACLKSPSFPSMQSLMQATFSIRFCYWLGATWFGPASFPLFKSDYQDLPLGQIRMILEIPEDRPACKNIFLLFEGSLTFLPANVFGLGPSLIETRFTDRSVEYLITPPVQFTLWSRLRFLIGGFFSPKTLLAELAFQQQHLKERQQEQSERALQSQAEFRAVIEHSPDGIFIHNQGRIAYVNPRMAAYLGYQDPSQLVGRDALSIVHPDSRALVQDRIESLRTGRTTVNPPREMDFLKENSSEPFHAEAVALTVTWEGKPATAVTVRDLTDRKKLQAHLMMTDRMMALGVLAAGVGHEVNNPLGYVLLNLEALKNNLKNEITGEIPAENAQHISDMEKGLERIRVIVKDLKAFTRGPDEHARAPVSLQSVLQSVVGMAKKEVEQRAQLKMDLAELPPVLASEARLGQVFLNLILNASQAVQPGQREANLISVRTSLVMVGGSRPWVQVEVQDSGAGMSEETQKHLFEPFFTTKPVGVGTGLGLSICHSIIEGFGGRIEFESALGKGTTFRVLLPALESDIALPSAVPLKELPTVESSGRVLIIDDDQALLEMTDFFISEDHETVSLTDAREAIALLEKGEQFDCILCDLMMPKLNGIQFYQKVAEVSPTHLPRIIYVTGGSFTDETHSFLSRPEIQHIEKPFETSHLRELVQDRVRRALAERQ